MCFWFFCGVRGGWLLKDAEDVVGASVVVVDVVLRPTGEVGRDK